MAPSLIAGRAYRNRGRISGVSGPAPNPPTSRRWGSLMHSVFYVIGVVVVVLVILRLAGFA
jgi:hypothetical protein